MCFGSQQQQQRIEPPKIRRRTSLRFDDGALEEVDSEPRRAEFSCQQQESVFREIAENEQRQDELTRRRGETAKGRSKTVSSMWDVENLSELYPAVDFSSLVSTSNTSPSALFGNSFSSSPPTTTSTPKSTMSDLRRLDDFLNTRRRRCQAKPGETPELPCDLRLGLKLRLESRKPFPWMVTTAPNQQAPTQSEFALHRLSYGTRISGTGIVR
ncbi:unnamed protein product [Anisakis simplex]|uniref:Uncharacterized protein n=1 Tax=Anisakis simplex TaxID=6269 RepID=A0A0M3JE81_ANISI|nr:unnamed protein product [Anisakis simplex]